MDKPRSGSEGNGRAAGDSCKPGLEKSRGMGSMRQPGAQCAFGEESTEAWGTGSVDIC